MKFIKLLNQIEKRPGMFIASTVQLQNLEQMFYGYGMAVSSNECDDISTFNSEFNDFLYEEFKITCSLGWASALLENTVEEECPLKRFFYLANEFFKKNYGIENAINVSKNKYEL